MVWKVERVKRCAIGSAAVGIAGVVLLGVSFGTTSWLAFPPGYFYLGTHSLFMGLFRDRACVDGNCGIVPDTEMRRNTQSGEYGQFSVPFLSPSLSRVRTQVRTVKYSLYIWHQLIN